MARDPHYDVLFEPIRIGPVTAVPRKYSIRREGDEELLISTEMGQVCAVIEKANLLGVT